MGAAVSINRLDLTASELRKAASGEKDSAAARRILALALVLDGVDRKTAAETCGMDRQTLRDWVHRYNAAGLAGLRNLKSPGPGSKLTARQQAELAELVDAGPDPAVHGVVRWRRVDLRDELQRRFGVALHERSVGKVLAKLGYRKLSVRPRHPRADEEAQETFKKDDPARLALASLPAWQRAGGVVPRARRHVGRAHTADRHCGHGAQAVDRALALRRDRGNTGWRRDPGGDNSRRIDRQELPPAAFAGGDTGNATVFFFGGTTPPRFRWVASRRATPRA